MPILFLNNIDAVSLLYFQNVTLCLYVEACAVCTQSDWVLLPVYASDFDVIPEKSLLHLWVSPAVASMPSFKPHVNKTVIERALPHSVSGYIHLDNMHKSCLYGYSLRPIFWLVCVCVCVCVLVHAINRSYNAAKTADLTWVNYKHCLLSLQFLSLLL